VAASSQDLLLREKLHLEPLLQISPTAIVITDLRANVVAWNPAAEGVFGYTAEEAMGRNLDDLVAKTEELHKTAVAYSERASGRDSIHTVARRTRKDGSLVDVELKAAPLVVDGQAVGTLGIYHDITELQRQKRFYEALLEVSPAAVVAIDRQDRVTLWNPAAERMFGYTAEEAMGRNIDDLVAKDPQIREEAEARGRQAEDEAVRATTRRSRRDGSLVDVELLGAPIRVAGEVVGRYAIYLDVSELQRRKEYYEALVEVSPTAIVTIDPQDNVTSWNPAAERLFGYTAAEAIGRNIDDLVANREDLRSEAEEVSRRIAHEQLRLIERRTRKDGSLVDVELTGAPIHMGGELVGMYGLFHDISDLQEQKRYFQALVELSPTAIVGTDLEARITSWNPAAERLFGYTAEEALGRHLDDLVAAREDLKEEASRYSQEALAGVRVHAFARRTRKDGSLVDVEILSQTVVVAEEQVGFLVIYHDITELQRQKSYHQSVLQFSPTAIVIVDEEFRITSWNPAAEELFGYTAEEAKGRFLDDLVANSPEIRDEAAQMNEAGRRGEGARMITRRIRKDRSLIDVEMVAAPVYVAGERVGHSVIYHDIGEIQRQRRYYEALVGASPIAVVLMDNDGTITSWNPAAERLFGYTPEEAIGKNIDDVVATSEEVREEAESLLQRAIDGAESVRAVTRRTRKDGRLVDVELLAVPVVIGGERVGFYVLYHDIGPLQQARREAEAAARAKSAFLATMSHEIRTPLNAVIGMTGLLLDTDLAPEQQGYAEVIRSSGDALLDVINEILDFSKIEAGRLDLEHRPFGLRQCVESALELVASPATEKGLDLAYQIDPRTPATIVGDSARLRQILLNLLNNAVKFTERGEVVLHVDSKPVGDGSTHEVHLAVRDTGIGIPEERMSRLFEAFSQVDSSTTRRYGGTGLGLAISRRLAEQMGGTVWAQSRLGAGSTFHVTITAEAVPGAVAGDELQAVPQLEGRRVLIVDDNATNREILRRQTERWRMVPRDVGSPREALQVIAGGEPFDVAILDMQMPELDGLALAKEIRRYRDRDELPLVMLTSLGRRERGPAAAEFAAHLTKPIRPSQLYDVLIGTLVPQLAPQRVMPAPPPVSEPASRLPLRILVAEDNAVNQRVALLLLGKLGYRADVAADGHEAIEALERQGYDVVLMDVQMPEVDGLEATRRIRQRWPRPDGPRIIAMTAGATESDREACLAAGMDDYISKPIRQEELAAAVSGAVVSPRGQGPAIEREALARLRDTVGGDEALADLVQTFLADSRRLLSDLRRDIKTGRLEDVGRHAHTLKSTAASFGASALADLSRELEVTAASAPPERLAELVDQMEGEFGRVAAALSDG
jgi:PAS domain S-box-containing protein